MSATQSVTVAAPHVKPKKPSSREKSHNDILIANAAAEPEETQTRICVLKLTYHVGDAHRNSKSPVLNKTELFSWKPKKETYEIQHGELKSDGSKFAMPDLDKSLCNRIIDATGISGSFPLGCLILYILKFRNGPKAAVKYMYKALIVIDLSGVQTLPRIGFQQPTITETVRSLLIEDFRDTTAVLDNTTDQRNDALAVLDPGQVLQQNYLLEAVAVPNNAMVDPASNANFYDPTSQRNDAFAIANPIGAVAFPYADVVMDPKWDTGLELAMEEPAFVMPAIPGNGYINQADFGDLYNATGQRNNAFAVTNLNVDAMTGQAWTRDFEMSTEEMVWPAEPANDYINPSELENLDNLTDQRFDTPIITDSAIPASHPGLDPRIIPDPIFSNDGPNFFGEFIAEDDSFLLNMPDITDHDQFMQDPMPALDEDFVAPPALPTVETQCLCEFDDLISPMGHMAPYIFNNV